MRAFWLLAWLLVSCVHAPAADLAVEIDGRAAVIDRAIEAGELQALLVAAEVESEGSPPEIRFYTAKDKLVAATVKVGHETWSTLITVYFYEDGKPMKYRGVVTGREPRPEQEAIFYGRDGLVIRHSVPTPRVDPEGLLATFKAIEAVRRAAARY
jgi:hypothetical protein